MGKTQIYVNGKWVMEHAGGYLPFIIPLSELGIKPGEDCLIALKVDNSDDSSYPPGKPQSKLDFLYHGGIYRDVWLVVTDPIHISDPNEAGRVAAGGLLVHTDQLTSQKATVSIQTDIQNDGNTSQIVNIEQVLLDPQGRPAGKTTNG
jgi:beta-galactosidase